MSEIIKIKTVEFVTKEDYDALWKIAVELASHLQGAINCIKEDNPGENICDGSENVLREAREKFL